MQESAVPRGLPQSGPRQHAAVPLALWFTAGPRGRHQAKLRATVRGLKHAPRDTELDDFSIIKAKLLPGPPVLRVNHALVGQ